jgi:uncharacterized protein YlxW (UPF0749 family)
LGRRRAHRTLTPAIDTTNLVVQAALSITDNCTPGASGRTRRATSQQHVIKLQQQIQTLQKENEDLEKRLARLEALTAKNKGRDANAVAR